MVAATATCLYFRDKKIQRIEAAALSRHNMPVVDPNLMLPTSARAAKWATWRWLAMRTAHPAACRRRGGVRRRRIRCRRMTALPALAVMEAASISMSG